jgi:hypothetical protein
MAWTVPMTFEPNTALTAAQLNTYLRDNMLETAPSKATTPGYHFVSTGPFSIAERPIVGKQINTQESTSSTSYTDLATPGPTITCETGSQAIYLISARMSNTASEGTGSTRASIDISGATTIAASDSRELTLHGVANGAQCKMAMAFFEDGLTPGMNTFTMKYKVISGTGTFAERNLIVIAL